MKSVLGQKRAYYIYLVWKTFAVVEGASLLYVQYFCVSKTK